MIIFKQFGKKTSDLYQSISLFFLFVGHLFYCVLFCARQIIWRHTLITTLWAGARVVLPLIIVSMMIGVSITLSIHYILAPFHLQNHVVFIAQGTMIRDFAPLPIGFILCVHCGLNLIDSDHPSLHHTPQKVILETIIPLMVGISCTALLL